MSELGGRGCYIVVSEGIFLCVLAQARIADITLRIPV
jgi:hypothetical protein